MILTLIRKYRNSDYTIGNLLIDGEYFCDTLEDTDRDLTSDMHINEIEDLKVKGKTAIPYGEYPVTLKVQSPRFKKSSKYAFCDGYLPRLLDVKGYEGVLIHIGNSSEDTDGCILVGKNKVKGKVVDSTQTFKQLYARLKRVNERFEPITLCIKESH